MATVSSDLEDAEAAASEASSSASDLSDELDAVEEELAAERGFKGEEAKQVAAREYETDFPISAAGEVGGTFIFKPTNFEKQGDKWLLTIETKNVSSNPRDPFCGGAQAVLLDTQERQYSGDSVLSYEGGGDNCGDSLQPGLTGTYISSFKLPANATPVAAYIYGEYSLEEEGKTWELPH